MNKQKHYYIIRNIEGDCYLLCWVWENSREEKEAIAKGFERISLKCAINLCVKERQKLKSPFYEGKPSSDKILPYHEAITYKYDLSEFYTKTNTSMKEYRGDKNYVNIRRIIDTEISLKLKNLLP